ncbi:hypothetical protein FC11_GL001694 [Lactobacillus helveticus DSM 20075 = CGMCC 1.1877]|nr:hypothetical protein FC11_GL001694 [Lactobacillus helveticus DSM 20075 = CGMCC 1.1877]
MTMNIRVNCQLLINPATIDNRNANTSLIISNSLLIFNVSICFKSLVIIFRPSFCKLLFLDIKYVISFDFKYRLISLTILFFKSLYAMLENKIAIITAVPTIATLIRSLISPCLYCAKLSIILVTYAIATLPQAYINDNKTYAKIFCLEAYFNVIFILLFLFCQNVVYASCTS